MMTKMQIRLLARQEKKFNGFFQMMEQQKTAGAAGVQNQRSEGEANAQTNGAEQNGANPLQLNVVGTDHIQVGTDHNGQGAWLIWVLGKLGFRERTMLVSKMQIKMRMCKHKG